MDFQPAVSITSAAWLEGVRGTETHKTHVSFRKMYFY